MARWLPGGLQPGGDTLLHQDLARKLAKEAQVAPHWFDWDSEGCRRSDSTRVVSGGD
jgi:hypothetical protein